MSGFHRKILRAIPRPSTKPDNDKNATCSTSNVIQTSSCSSPDTIVTKVEDLIRIMHTHYLDIEDKLLNLAEQSKAINTQSHLEYKQLQVELEKKTNDCKEFERNLSDARKLLDQERKFGRKVKDERDILKLKLARVTDLVFDDNCKSVKAKTKEQCEFMNSTTRDSNVVECKKNKKVVVPINLDFSAINEGHTTGSLLSDVSCTISEDGLDTIRPFSSWKPNRPNVTVVENKASNKIRQSTNTNYLEIGQSDKVCVTTTLTVTKDGPVTATSVIESLSPKENRQAKEIPHLNKEESKQHSLYIKTLVIPVVCDSCDKRIIFGKTCYKCKYCLSMCHMECVEKLPLPCIPSFNTPAKHSLFGVIADYAPSTSPMVPTILLQCIKEIEARGLNLSGLYREPSVDGDVKSLKDQFLRGKGVTTLIHVNIHVLCGIVKDFLHSLQEPLLTHSHWKDFMEIVSAKEEDVTPLLHQLVSKLPQPNRDTLAYLMLHLKRVAQNAECEMPVETLAKIFGPIIVRHFSILDYASKPNQTSLQTKVVQYLLNLSNDYWSSLNVYC